jgi:hypothetical protein
MAFSVFGGENGGELCLKSAVMTSLAVGVIR